MRHFRKYFFLLTEFTVCMIIFQACASKPPVLYQNGKPFAISEYEKIAQKEFDDKKFTNSIAAYEAIIKNYPENTKAIVWAHYEIGFCYLMQKKYEDAERYFRIVINDYQEPAARKLAEDRIAEIIKASDK
jgi:TolA-binding protein